MWTAKLWSTGVAGWAGLVGVRATPDPSGQSGVCVTPRLSGQVRGVHHPKSFPSLSSHPASQFYLGLGASLCWKTAWLPPPLPVALALRLCLHSLRGEKKTISSYFSVVSGPSCHSALGSSRVRSLLPPVREVGTQVWETPGFSL